MEKWLWDDFVIERIRLSDVIKFNLEKKGMDKCNVYATTKNDEVLMFQGSLSAARMYVQSITSEED